MLTARYPGGATFNIVGPERRSDVDVRASNNIENGTSAAHRPYPHALPERMPGTRPVGRAGATHRRRKLSYLLQALDCLLSVGRCAGIHSKFKIQNSKLPHPRQFSCAVGV